MTIDRALQAHRDYCAHLATASGGTVRELPDGGLLWAGTDPAAEIVNGALGPADGPASLALVEEADTFFGARGHRFSVCTRDERDAGLENALRRAGWVVAVELPVMAVEPTGCATPALPDGLVVRPVTDESDVATFARVAAPAFGLPGSVRSAFGDPAAVLRDDTAAVLGLLDGEPVACALSWTSGRSALVGWVATHGSARRKGIGAAVTAAVVAGAAQRGADLAVLCASPAGLPVYRSLGFTVLSVQREHQRSSWLAEHEEHA